MIQLVYKDIKTVIITAIYLFKKLEERLMILSRELESIKKNQINYRDEN